MKIGTKIENISVCKSILTEKFTNFYKIILLWLKIKRLKKG